MNFILGIGIGISLLAIFQLMKEKNAKLISTKIAVLINIVWIVRLAFFLIKDSEIALKFPILLMLDQNLLLLDSVVLWMYSKSLLNTAKFKVKTLLNFLPFIIGFLISVATYLSVPNELIVEQYIKMNNNISSNKSLFTIDVLVLFLVIIIISIIYFSKSIVEIKKYNSILYNHFSSLKNINANWILKFHGLWISLFLIPIILYFINYMYPIINIKILLSIMIIIQVLFSFIFNSNVLSQNYVRIPEKSNIKQDNKSIKEFEEQISKLKKTLNTNKYYQDENLSLVKLSSYLNIKPTELTEIIKCSEFENFYDLINTYRIESIKKELLSSTEQIMIIAYNNGFNSKSAFNRIFKDKIGQTPSNYRSLYKNTS
ncbi:AraC family transcriptional regulator [Olleya sp. YS]|uniref:helix-turn-helix domain-containing protein n=1 Tax=Olleya sp. YS TaxID=3028318 RepID=UPI002434150B|nr:AraC family transcriptional regulator [Olleya sp. YS]WGD35058.1 AraC family transcriptional regulator [Olleya sp. YS]